MNKYLKYLIPLLFTLAILLGLLQRNEGRYTVNNQNSKIRLSDEAQKELWGFYKKSQQFSSKDEEGKTSVSFLAVGDIMLSRKVAGKIQKSGDLQLPFRMMKNTFDSVDFSFGTLASPFSGEDTFNTAGSIIFNAPRDNIKGLVESKFKILNLANNHALDQDEDGLAYTLKYLDDNNIKHIGAGMNLNEAWQPATLDANGIKICFIGASYASINDNGQSHNNYIARIEDLDKLKTAILNLKSSCDFTVATMHAGKEYTRTPNDAQIKFAHAAIDAGADVVIGHHPHWVQTIERYCPAASSSPGEEKMPEGLMRSNCLNPKYIFYSLGNFIFDQMWSQETREGLTLKIQISINQTSNLQSPRQPAQLDSIELIPVIIDNYSTPRPANPDETKSILEKIGETNTLLK
ncbi:MAG: CapA family protein [Candidatus Doudnabacteria bacterium]|nr:CapA family protein [Candidatus Doudnabacteria bacterium]